MDEKDTQLSSEVNDADGKWCLSAHPEGSGIAIAFDGVPVGGILFDGVDQDDEGHPMVFFSVTPFDIQTDQGLLVHNIWEVSDERPTFQAAE